MEVERFKTKIPKSCYNTKWAGAFSYNPNEKSLTLKKDDGTTLNFKGDSQEDRERAAKEWLYSSHDLGENHGGADDAQQFFNHSMSSKDRHSAFDSVLDSRDFKVKGGVNLGIREMPFLNYKNPIHMDVLAGIINVRAGLPKSNVHGYSRHFPENQLFSQNNIYEQAGRKAYAQMDRPTDYGIPFLSGEENLFKLKRTLPTKLNKLRSSNYGEIFDRIMGSDPGVEASQKARFQKRYDEISKQQSEELSNLTGQHKQKVNEISQQQSEELSRLTGQHKQKVNKISQQHSKELSNLTGQHKQKVNEILKEKKVDMVSNKIQVFDELSDKAYWGFRKGMEYGDTNARIYGLQRAHALAKGHGLLEHPKIKSALLKHFGEFHDSEGNLIGDFLNVNASKIVPHKIEEIPQQEVTPPQKQVVGKTTPVKTPVPIEEVTKKKNFLKRIAQGIHK